MSAAPAIPANVLADLPPNVGQILDEFVQALLAAAGPQVESVILFGSAAEGQRLSNKRSNCDLFWLLVRIWPIRDDDLGKHPAFCSIEARPLTPDP